MVERPPTAAPARVDAIANAVARPDVLPSRPAQTARLARFGLSMSVDMHCHCLPGLDDGPATLEDALSLCRALADDGVTAVIATPHQLGRFTGITTASVVREAVHLLRRELAARHVPLDVRPGAEVRVDEQFLKAMASGDLLGLPDGGPHVLLELAPSSLPDLRPLVERLVVAGKVPILAHPERHEMLARSPHLLLPWLERGLLLQVTAASLAGDFGGSPMNAAWRMVESGWVSMVGSDAHDIAGRGPALGRAIDVLAVRIGHAIARRLCLVHPLLVFQGKAVPRPTVRRGRGRQ